MSITAGGSNRSRNRFRAELRGIRLQRRLSLSDVSDQLGWPTSRLPDIEYGEVGLSDGDLAELLELYGIRDPAEVHALHELARTSRERMWWHAYQKSLPPEYVELISAESDAARITHFHSTFVPGLLQTRPYATAITPPTTLTTPSESDADMRVDARMRRQCAVLYGPQPAELTAIVDETVLCRRVGSNAIMCEQLDRLVESVAQLVVVPVDAGPHPGLLGPFMLVEYDDPRVGDVLCFEWARGNVVVRDRLDLLLEYRALAERLVRIGLRGEAAVQMIQSARQRFTNLAEPTCSGT
jgi:Domain of unknown function (DUF5753)/Helix-turn-helix domain